MSIWGKIKHGVSHAAKKVAGAVDTAIDVAGPSIEYGSTGSISAADKLETNQLPGESTDASEDLDNGDG